MKIDAKLSVNMVLAFVILSYLAVIIPRSALDKHTTTYHGQKPILSQFELPKYPQNLSFRKKINMNKIF